MKTKFVAGILMAVASLCFLAVDGISQSTVPGSPTRQAQPAQLFAQGETAIRSVDPALMQGGGGSLEELVQQLRYVRQQQKALEAQEVELLKRIDLKVEEQRRYLQNADELRKQLRQERGQVGRKADAKEPTLNRGGKQ